MAASAQTDIFMKMITDKIDSIMNKKLKPYGLTGSQLRVLHHLRITPSPVSQRELELTFEVAHPTMVGLLKRLEQKGFVRTEFDSDNKRRKNVYMTEKCDAFFQYGDDSRNDMIRILLSGFDDEQIEAFDKALQHMYNNLKSL